MSHVDHMGAPVSHTNAEDIAVFGKAVDSMLAYAPDPARTLKGLLETAPDFIMARCFLAGIYLTASDKTRQPLMRSQLDILKTQAPNANDRERQHIAALDLWEQGDFYGASQAYADILNMYPRDLVALQIGHQTDFLLGQVTSTRDRPARVIPYWSEADPQYSYILGMQAFGMEESGHYAEAQKLAETAVNLNKRDTWSIHALAHCYEMQGNVDEGIKFMISREDDWGQDNYMSIHNRWHLMLYHLEREEHSYALKIHDKYMAITPDSELMDAHDSTALLQRLSIFGVDVGDRWNAVAERYSPVADQAYMAFNDIHAMMAFTAAERLNEAEAQLDALRWAAETGEGTSAQVLQIVGLSLVEGFYAYGKGQYREAARLLAKGRHNSRLIGGSDAQRDIISLTLLDAAMKDKNKAMVRALLAERKALKPHAHMIQEIASHHA